MTDKIFNWKWFLYALVFVLIMAACSNEEPEIPTPELPEATAATAEEEAATAVPTPTSEPPAAADTEETEAEETPPPPPAVIPDSGVFDFEDGTTQTWVPRGEVSLTVVSDVANSGSQSLLISNRTENWNGADLNVQELLEPGNLYEISAYVRLAEGAPDSRIVVTMQRTAVGADPVYEWIAPSDENGVTDSAWVFLSGRYSYNGEAEELLLYLESPDEELVDFYIDDLTITLLPPEDGAIIYDFEDGTTQGWAVRGDTTVTAVDQIANSGSQSLSITGRTDTWQGTSLNMLSTLQPDNTYEFSFYVRLAEGEPPSQIILTMQRTPASGSTQYEWIAASEADGVTDSEWVQLQGQYAYSGAVTELLLYLESPDSEFVSFYIDDFTITGALETPIQTNLPSLYETLSPYFLVGAALEPDQLNSSRHATLLTHHFNSLTAENVMKPGSIQPNEGQFNWTNADTLVQFARDNGLAVHGHTFVWHQQAAEWMFQDENGNPLEATEANKELVLQRLQDYIRAVAERYKDDINVWDVVNEVIDPAQPDCMRRSAWYELTGIDYIVTAFQTAREVLPETVLLINDYSTTDPVKRECIYDLVQTLQEMGVPIDGIGMQMHVNIQNPSIAAIEAAIVRFAELGEVHITELDMSIYTNDVTSYETVPDEILLQQAYRYQEIFEILKNHADVIGSVTFWGMADDHTWLKTFPTTRLNLPLLFDEQLQAKPAYWAIVDPNQLPVQSQDVAVPKGTAVIDGAAEVIWITQAWTTLYASDTMTISYQTRWDEGSIYLFMDIAGTPQALQTIDVFIDANNGKTADYEDDDRHYSFQDGTCSTCDDSVIYVLSADENAGQLEAAFPLAGEVGIGDEVGFDIRLTIDSQPDDPISWNDRTHSQDSSTANYGVLTLADAPKITAAVAGTPIIDGEEDEIWANAHEEVTDTWVLGSSGSTAVVRTMWDSEYLYVLAIVTDSLLDKSSANVYEQDSFEVFIDQNNAKTSTYQPDDGQYRINYDNEASFNGGAAADLLTSATKITEDGYIVELAIKFDAIVPEEGMIIGFDFQVNNDENGDGLRDSAVTWNDPTHQSYQNTSRLGLLIFTQ